MTWKPIQDEPIPKQAKGLIIPGGFPENHAEQLSSCTQSMKSLRDFFGRRPIYAECGGMLLLGQTLTDLNGKVHKMAGLIPFNATRGSVKVGYRNINCKRNGLITTRGDQLIGHEFHHWELNINNPRAREAHINYLSNKKTNTLWKVRGWGTKETEEGWSGKFLHASWIHLHWPSSPKIMNSWRESLDQTK